MAGAEHACKLLELPPEVRLLIYHDLFSSSRSISELGMTLHVVNGRYWCMPNSDNRLQSRRPNRTYMQAVQRGSNEGILP